MLPLVALFLVVVAAEEPVNLGDLPMQNPDLFEGDILGIDDGDISDKNAISNPGLKWPGATVPYVIDRSLSGIQHLISRAMQDYHTKTCVKFVPRTHESHYISLFAGQGCYSYVGCIRQGKQDVSLGRGCEFVGTIVHELGHAIGFYHEQNRSDRDDYLTIYWANIQNGMASQFQKLMPHENLLLTAFDFNSIMLYGNTAFSKDGRSITMAAKSGVKLYETYDKPGLSTSDVQRVNKLYC